MDNVHPPPRSATSESAYGHRLTEILRRLNLGEKLCPKQLAAEFGVDIRSVQRDLNQRFAFLGLHKADGKYALPLAMLGKLQWADIERFAALAGVKGLFPSLTDTFLREILDNRAQAAWLVKGNQYEDLGGKEIIFQQLEEAILHRHPIRYTYQKPEGVKTYTNIQPYKLVNHDGIWYLAALDGGALKSFTIIKIDRLDVLRETLFTPDAAIEKTLQDEDGIWLNAKKIEVILKITGTAASYFQRRKLVSNQSIIKNLEAGGMIVSAKVAHPNQILPIVRQWIPDIRIISPETMQADMERGLIEYLNKV